MRGSVGTGRRARLRILWQQCREGSSPFFRSRIDAVNMAEEPYLSHFSLLGCAERCGKNILHFLHVQSRNPSKNRTFFHVYLIFHLANPYYYDGIDIWVLPKRQRFAFCQNEYILRTSCIIRRGYIWKIAWKVSTIGVVYDFGACRYCSDGYQYHRDNYQYPTDQKK